MGRVYVGCMLKYLALRCHDTSSVSELTSYQASFESKLRSEPPKCARSARAGRLALGRSHLVVRVYGVGTSHATTKRRTTLRSRTADSAVVVTLENDGLDAAPTVNHLA